MESTNTTKFVLKFAAFMLSIVAVMTFAPQSASAEIPRPDRVVEREIARDWANPSHYASAEEIINWSANGGELAPFDAMQPTTEPRNPFSIRTNLLYFVGGVINAGIEWQPVRSNFAFVLNGGYSPFGGDDWKHSMGGWFVSPEVRYYFANKHKWFVGGQFLACGYNVKITDGYGRQGNMIGAGVMGGYRMKLSKIFDMDFTLGAGYGSLNYDTYKHSNGVNVLAEKDIHKDKFIPLQLGVNLILKIQ